MLWRASMRFAIAMVFVSASILAGCSPRPSTEEYNFDTEGQLTSIRLRDGDQIQYSYDDSGRVKELRFKSGWIRYGYEPGGARAWEKNGNGYTEYFRDDLGRITHVLWSRGTRWLLNYGYDSWGRLTDLKAWSLDEVAGAGRMSSLKRAKVAPPPPKPAPQPSPLFVDLTIGPKN